MLHGESNANPSPGDVNAGTLSERVGFKSDRRIVRYISKNVQPIVLSWRGDEVARATRTRVVDGRTALSFLRGLAVRYGINIESITRATFSYPDGSRGRNHLS